MRFIELAKPKKIQIYEKNTVPIPSGWVLIKTLFCGLCGSDVHAYYEETIFGNHYPFHIGHEVCGLVKEVNDSSSDLSFDDLVVINPFFTCDICHNCHSDKSNYCDNFTTIGLHGPGGFSEYICVPKTSVYKCRNSIKPERLCFAEPIANVLYALEKVKITHSSDILINGMGPIGLIFLQMVIGMKPHEITACDVNDKKILKAKEFGIDYAVTPEKVDSSCKFDLIIDCTGIAKCIQSDIARLKRGGCLLSFGVCSSKDNIEINPFYLYQNDITILSSFALNKSAMQHAVDLLAGSYFDTDSLMDGVRKIDDLEKSIIDIYKGNTKGKIIIDTF